MLKVKLDGVEIGEDQLDRLNKEMDKKKSETPVSLGCGTMVLIGPCRVNPDLWHIELSGPKFSNGELPLNRTEMRQLARLIREAAGE